MGVLASPRPLTRSSFFGYALLNVLGALTDAELGDPEVGKSAFWQNGSCAAIASISSRLVPTAKMIPPSLGILRPDTRKWPEA